MQVQIEGVDYWVEVGVERCTMQALFRGPDGMVVAKGEAVDLRSRSSLAADHGEVKIRTKSKPVPLVKTLRMLADFARHHSRDELAKILA